MILLEDNLALYKHSEEYQRKKAEMVEFDDYNLELLKKGFDEEDLVSLAASSLISYDDYL